MMTSIENLPWFSGDVPRLPFYGIYIYYIYYIKMVYTS